MTTTAVRTAPATPVQGAGPSLPHRPGLDGVRALAVAAVVLYHGGVAAVPGGFLGVDVFFVLSGYLITSLLLAEHADTGRIDLPRFWLRRARRLLPAAVVVIAASLLVAAIFLPSTLASARADALASLLYVNNWQQIVAERSYFEAFGPPSLFQHLWSLAVEEQFYLLWPLVLSVGLLWRRPGRLIFVTAGLIAASVLLMAVLYDPKVDPSRVYYGTDTRAATVLVGALLAFLWPMRRMTAATGRGAGLVLDGVGLAGLAVLGWTMFGWHDYDPFLYQWGFLAVALAAAVVVAACVHPAARLGVALGVAPLRWIGQRSYGIYLWHWPVMAVTRPGIDVTLTPWLLVPLQIAATVALAALSYRYVEMPFRRGRVQAGLRRRLDTLPPRGRLASVAGVALALALAGSWVFTRPVPSAASPPQRPTPAAVTPPPAIAPAATAQSGAAPDDVLAIGASVMLAASPALEDRFGSRMRVDASVGRQIADVVARLDAYRAEGTLPDDVVIQVGENGPLFREDLLALRRSLRGVPRVVLVNVRVPRSWESQVDDALAETREWWPAVRVADWHAASGRSGLLYDGVHPNAEGQGTYARLVARTLRGS